MSRKLSVFLRALTIVPHAEEKSEFSTRCLPNIVPLACTASLSKAFHPSWRKKLNKAISELVKPNT